jgi:hypothetical protein
VSDLDIQHLLKAGRWSDARDLAARGVAGAVECTATHALLAHILLHTHRRAQARAVVEAAADLSASDADACDGLAFVATALDLHDIANTLYRRATELAPRVARHWHNLANSERSYGRLDAAEQACDLAIARDERHFPTVLLRSEMRPQTAESNHIDELQRRLADSRLDPTGRVFIGYALAKELDDVQRYAEAFQRFSAAARLRRTQFNYAVARDESRLAHIAAVFSAGPAPPQPPTARTPGRCIFIVGLPRTGTTLVERILTGLGGVRSNGETDNVARALTMAAPAGGAGRADVIERAAAADPARVAAAYVELARIGPGDIVIDKLPSNALYLGAIQRALPDATILLLERNPLDACFAMYRSLFGDAYPFSYDFDELARYVAAHTRLMAHWRERLGSAMLTVSYEELVGQPEAVGTRIAAHCGLVWQPGALEIQRNQSVSLTASASQVRRPIYGSSSDRWRHYRQPLQPLIDALRLHGLPTPPDA